MAGFRSILVSQGRIADRTPGAIAGARALAAALAHRTGLDMHPVGTPRPYCQDGWSSALSQAKPCLDLLSAEVSHRIAATEQLLIVANTCSASIATLPAAARLIDGLTVLWIDAHGDFNTPEITETSYLGGMALAGACGLWDTGHGGDVSPDRVILLAARDIDPAEDALITGAAVRRLPATAPAGDVLAAIDHGPVWLHIDWDVMEPGPIPAAYAVPGGLSPQRLREILAAIPCEQIVGIELAEFEMPVNPAAADRAITTILTIIDPLLDGHPPARVSDASDVTP